MNELKAVSGVGGQRESLFAQFARVFDGWTDADTGVRVLRIRPKGEDWRPGLIATPYQQSRAFFDGGRKVMLRHAKEGKRAIDHDSNVILLDLTTGLMESLPPVIGYDDRAEYGVRHDPTGDGQHRTALLNLRTGEESSSVTTEDDWQISGGTLLADGRRVVVAHSRGVFYDEYCQTRFYLLSPGEEPRLILEMDGFRGNHLMACPTDPELFAYNAWPTPKPDYVDGVTSIASADGRVNYVIPLDDRAPRPGDFWGVRDHYVWTPDGNRIVSYLDTARIVYPSPDFNHFTLDWWLSSLDWRTGVDDCAQYPPGRWGGHMQTAPDSRWIVNGGGPGFDKLYAVDLWALKDGWNEQIICSYPETNAEGALIHYYPYPFVLPDQSGVIFNAGWLGPEHGVYLAEWPAWLG